MRTAAACLERVPARIRDACAASGARLYLVGGFVRDALLDRSNHDLDLAVDGDARAAAGAIAARLGGALVPLDPQRGTYRVALREPLDGFPSLDLTRLRAPSIDEDLVLRDFTINAIATPIAADEAPRFLDPTGGLEDLARGVVRMASPSAFADDPLRPLRAVRIATTLGFAIEPDTARAARRAAPALSTASAERQRDELSRVIALDNAAAGVRLLDELGLLSALLPDLDAARGCTQPAEHAYDVFEHSLQTLAALDLILRADAPPAASERARWQAVQAIFAETPRLRQRLDRVAADDRPWRATLKLTGLLHDVSKPETKSIDPQTGRVRFYGHPALGAARAAALLRGLRFSAKEIAYVQLLITEHLRPGMLAAPGETPTRRALYRFFRDLGDATADLLLLNLADHAAARGPRLTLDEWSAHVAYSVWLLRMLYGEEQVASPLRLVTGDDLMAELGLRPGKAVGVVLEAVREAQAAGEVRDRAGALDLARRTLAELGGGQTGRGGA